MGRKNRLSRPVLACFMALALLSAGCGRETEEEKIGRAIQAIVQGIEGKDSGKAVESLAESYRDFEGRGIPETRAFLFWHFRRNPKIRVYILAQSIRIEGNAATVQSNATTVGLEGIVPERGQVLNVTSRWEKREGAWKAVHAEWLPMLEDLPGKP